MGGGGDTVIQAPAAPNYAESMRDILTAQVEMAPKVYESEAKFQPLYNVLQANQQAFQAQQALNMARQAYPQIADIEASYNIANRQAELGQLQAALPAYQQAFNALTPGYAQAVAASGQLAQQSMQQALTRPQFASFEAGVRDPYGMPIAGQPVPPLPLQPQVSQPPAAASTQQKTKGKGTPAPPTQTGFANQMQQQLQSAATASTATQPTTLRPTTLQETPAGFYAGAVKDFEAANVTAAAGTPKEAGFLNRAPTIAAALKSVGPVPTAANVARIAGPTLASDIQNLNQQSVNQYISAMPGMGQYANMLAQQSQAELAAGRGLTAEEQRLADQSARAAYAARGTALGSQAVNAEILNRADVANQRYQQRLQNAAQAAGTIQAIYQPALQQSLQRQQLGIDYGLGVQQQAFGQAQTRDVMAQQLQAQRYAQAMGAQTAGFEQAMGREGLSQQIQQQRYGQLMGQQQLLQGAQAQRYEQAMGREQLRAGTQQAAFQQALSRSQAQQQAYMAGTQAQAGLAQLGAGTMGQLQAAQAPVLQAFYKQPILQGQQAQSQQTGMMMQQQAGPQYFNPESQTGMGSIYGAYNSQMNLAAAQAQANAGKKAGMMGMIGNLGGSAIGAAGLLAFCWVAREVYGAENPKWLQFRKWMLAEADDNLLDAYITHGPKIAEFISDKPDLKQMIKTWMDSKIS